MYNLTLKKKQLLSLMTGGVFLFPQILPLKVGATPLGTFLDWCLLEEPMVSPSPKYQGARHTVEVLLELAGTQECELAQEKLSTLPLLNLAGKQITNLRPLSSLTNLQLLLLIDNQITDVSPLANLTNLTQLDLPQNQITDISSLATLTKVRFINVTGNPIARKICPLRPANVCVFDDDGATIAAEAEAAYQRGDFRQAKSSWEEARKIYSNSEDTLRLANSLNRLGDTHSNLGEYGQAISLYYQASKLRQELGDIPGQLLSLTSLGQIYQRLGQNDKARTNYEAALKNIQAQEASQALFNRNPLKLLLEKAALLNNLALLENKLKQHESALRRAGEGLKIYKNVPLEDEDGLKLRALGRRTSLDAIGISYLRLKQYKEALLFLQQALKVAEKIGDKAGTGTTLTNIGDVYQAQGEGNPAISYYQQALALHREVGNKAGEGITLHHLGIAYWEMGKVRKAIAHLYEAVQIWESIRPELDDANKVSLFETQTETFKLLQTALVRNQKTKEALEIAERGRARAFIELLAKRTNSETAESIQSVEPLGIKDIQTIAKERKATLVEYSLVEDELYIWLVKPSGKVHFQRQNLGDLETSLAELVQSSRESIGVRGRGSLTVAFDPGDNQEENLTELYELLIEPIAQQLPKNPGERVIFMPQQSLFLVPFTALKDQEGKYLIQKYTVLTAPSIQILQLTGERESAGEDILIVGNPTMPEIVPEAGREPQRLSSLPGAEEEAIAIGNILDTEVLTGDRATKAAVLAKLSDSKIVHFATHGLLDDFGTEVPGAIALAPTEEDDGLLKSAEILNLEINADLVVLSACDTGRGEITGDGVIGLSRSLITAGVPSLIASLWAVPDAPTAELMTQFYRELQGKEDKAAALRLAMLKTMEKYPNPKDWAAFTLMGEAE